MPSRPSTPAAIDVAERSTIWDTQVPALADRTLRQWCEPLAQVQGTQNRAAVLGILYDIALEQQRRRPGYTAFAVLDPLTVRQQALQAEEEQSFQQLLYLEASRRLLQDLRQLRLKALGYPEQPGLFETLEEQHARETREQKQQALLQAGAKPRHQADPAFEALFQPRVKAEAVVAALQRNGIVSAEGQWLGLSGKANDLMALLTVLEESGYLLPVKRARLVRVFTQRFAITIPASYANRRDKLNPQVAEYFANLFPGHGIVSSKQIAWRD